MSYIQDPSSDATLSADDEMGTQQPLANPASQKAKMKQKRKKKNTRPKIDALEGNVVSQICEAAIGNHHVVDPNYQPIIKKKDIQLQTSNQHPSFESAETKIFSMEPSTVENTRPSSSQRLKNLAHTNKLEKDIQPQTSSSHHIKFNSPEREAASRKTRISKGMSLSPQKLSPINVDVSSESEIEETITSAAAQVTLDLQKQRLSSSASQKSKNMPVAEIPFKVFKHPIDNNHSTGDESTSSLGASSPDSEERSKRRRRTNKVETHVDLIGNPLAWASRSRSSSSSSSSLLPSSDSEELLRKKSKLNYTHIRPSNLPINSTLKSNSISSSGSSSSSDDENPTRKKRKIKDPSSVLQEPSRVSPSKLKWLKDNVMRAQRNNPAKREESDAEDNSASSEAEASRRSLSASPSASRQPSRVSPQKLQWLEKNVMRPQAEGYVKHEADKDSTSDDDEEEEQEFISEEPEMGLLKLLGNSLLRNFRPRPQPTQSSSSSSRPKLQNQLRQSNPRVHPTQPGFRPLSQLPPSLLEHIKSIYHLERHGGQLTYKELKTLTSHLTHLQLRLHKTSTTYLGAAHSAFLLKQILRHKKHLTAGMRSYRKKQYELYRSKAERNWRVLGEKRYVVQVLERTVDMEWRREGLLWNKMVGEKMGRGRGREGYEVK